MKVSSFLVSSSLIILASTAPVKRQEHPSFPVKVPGLPHSKTLPDPLDAHINRRFDTKPYDVPDVGKTTEPLDHISEHAARAELPVNPEESAGHVIEHTTRDVEIPDAKKIGDHTTEHAVRSELPDVEEMGSRVIEHTTRDVGIPKPKEVVDHVIKHTTRAELPYEKDIGGHIIQHTTPGIETPTPATKPLDQETGVHA